MWGKHLILDVRACDKAKITDAEAIERWVKELVRSIDMKAFGDPIIVHFAEHSLEAAGYSLVQLIETSAITGHFSDHSGDAYLDIFSCKDFDPDVVVSLVNWHFKPEAVRSIVIERQA